MINNWDILSHTDTQTGTVRFTLVIDGTEQDARLIAKKLKGYVQEVRTAQAPFSYVFELPSDMDDITQEKIRVAANEGVEQINQVNTLVPGGVLGAPLFNAPTSRTTKGYPTFFAMDPATSFFEGVNQASPHKHQVDLSFVTQLGIATMHTSREHLISSPHAETSQLSATVKEVFATARTQATPEDLPSIKVVQIQPQFATPTQEAATEKETNPTLSVPPASPNTFHTRRESTISITDNDMLIKDMEGSMLSKMPLEDILSAETKYDMFVDVDKTPQQAQKVQQQKAQKIVSAQPDGTGLSFNVFEHELKDQTNIIDVEEVSAITEKLPTKTMDAMKKPEDLQTTASAKTDTQDFQAQQQVISMPDVPAQEAAEAAAQVPFTLGASSQQPSNRPLMADASSDSLPEEEVLAATMPPKSLDGADDKNALDKTFNLETTFNTEVIKRQYEKTVSLREGRVSPMEEEAPHMKTILRLKKKPAPQTAAQQTPQTPEAPQEEGALGQTMFRLRKKQTPPASPAAPQVAPVLKSTMSPQHAADNVRQAKTKNIDHSIQLPVSELKKHNWPLEVPLVPTYTLKNMVMSVNRFAHATAVSVIESPGKLYNPLVLHGGTGTGKTHFLNALAYAFSQKFGQEHIFMTNGVRLSRGIQRYVMEGNIAKFETFMQSVRALLIDDIHLLAINEQNRAFISKLLNTFLKEHKQIVITSKYPPESLEKLEELINFKLDSGWISELKPATGATHFRIVKKMLSENGVDLNDRQIEEFFGSPHMTLGTVTRSIRRLKVLENLMFPGASLEQKSPASILEKLLATKGEDASSALLTKDPASITSINTVGNGEWGRIGFFYPQSSSDMMNWMVYALEQRAKELGIEGGFEIVVRSSYATENIISSAFKIANLCDNKKLKGAVILGPNPNTCDLSVRENFYDILTHMLEIMLIRCGIINFENIRQPSTYVKVISELMR